MVEHIMVIGNVLNLFATMVRAIWYRRKSIRTTVKLLKARMIPIKLLIDASPKLENRAAVKEMKHK